MVNALSSSYQCPSIGFRQMVPPLPTSGSHPAAFRARLVDPFSEKACLLCGIGTSLCATVLHLRSHSARPSSTPVLHYCWLVVVPLVLSGYTEEHDGGRNDTNPELPTLQQ